MNRLVKLSFLMALCILGSNLLAQDIITTKLGDEIKAKIIEINPKEIIYKKFDYQSGPTIIISKSDVFMIKYPNGSKDVFTNNIEEQKTSESLIVEGVYLLKAGTTIQIELAETISSKSILPGQVVYFKVKNVVEIQGVTLIKAGQSLKGVVTKAEKAKELGKQGELFIQVSSVLAVDGQEVMLSGNIFREGENKSAESIGIAALIFWPALFMKGKEAEILAGTVFNATVGETTYVKP